MDPWSIAAVVGLVFAGRRINSTEDPADAGTNHSYRNPGSTRNPIDHTSDYFEKSNITPDIGRRIGDTRIQPKNEIASLQTVASNVQYPFGQPVYNLYDRENVSNKMNNLNPVDKKYVGRGLGVCADVPAAGGFQQFFRVLPTNVNEERLNTLPGADGGPANPVVKGGAVNIGEVTQYPEKTYYHEPIASDAQGQGGALRGQEARPQLTKTSRPTIRAETGNETFIGPAQYNVSQPYNDTGFKKLSRLTDNRSKMNRAGNAGGMNVRADPISVIGDVTNLRRDLPGDYVGPADPGHRFTQYIQPAYVNLNDMKSSENPLVSQLGIAKMNIANNPYQISIN